MTWWQTILEVIGGAGVLSVLLAGLWLLFLGAVEAFRKPGPPEPFEVFDFTEEQNRELEEWIQGGAR